MKRIQLGVDSISTTVLSFGFVGENKHVQIVISWSALYSGHPSAVATMIIKSPSGTMYPKTIVQDAGKITFDVTAADCAREGVGQYQLTFTDGEEVIKTYIGSFIVTPSLVGSGDPPDPVEDWLQEAQEALAAFDQDVTDAEAWAAGTRDGEPVESTDPAYENNSKYYAEQAEEVLESIPSDYTELSEDVDALHAIKAPAIESSVGPAPIVSISDGADGMPVKTLNVSIEPVQEGSGDPSPENVRPISGWTGANVSRTGKNLATTSIYKQDYVLTDAGAESPSTNFCITDIVPIISGNKYVCSYIRASSGSDVVRIGFYDADMNFLSRPVFSNSGDVITAPAEAKYARLSYRNVTPDLTNIQLEQGQTASAYQPFGAVYTYEFPSSAGTVYGGTLTIHQDGSGELVVDRANVDMGTLTWTKNDSSLIGVPCFYAYLPNDVKPGAMYSACSQYVIKGDRDHIDGSCQISPANSSTATYCVARDDAYASDDAATFKTAMSGVQLVYELATPVTYQLTNQQVIETLKGNNNLWADTGNVTLEYPADTKLYIDGKIAELQALILENISNS